MPGFSPIGGGPIAEGAGVPGTAIHVTQAGVLVAETSDTPIRVTQAHVLSAINYPTEEMRITQAGVHVAAKYDGLQTRVSQAHVLVAARGRIDSSRLRAWTFSLDGHDFYVLRLGDDLTLVYDVSSEQWMDWANLDTDFWRANVGMNWTGGIGLADDYGSNVIIGDDTYGLLWFLDPDQAYDEHPDYLNVPQEIYFDRIVMGQVPLRGREVLPCYSVWLTTDMGNPAYLGAGVTLYTSDDAGETFDSHGLVTVTAGVRSPELSWYSLGQIGAPGRLFKLVDDGAVTRIDGLEMNDAG